MERMCGRIAAIAAIILVGCREIREVEVDPVLDTTSSTTSADLTSSSSSSTETGTDAQVDRDSDDGSGPEPGTDGVETTSGAAGDVELFCGEPFALVPESPVLLLEDSRTIATLEVSVRLQHSSLASVELALRGDGVRRILLAPDRIDCASELNAQFSDAGEIESSEVCSVMAKILRIVPVDSLDVFSDRPLAGEWILEVSGDAREPVGDVSGWCLAVQFEA